MIEFGNIGNLDGRGERAIMVIFLSMQRDTTNVVKIKESPIVTSLPFSLAKAIRFVATVHQTQTVAKEKL